ncbi:MAG: lipoprotein-releasing ABC transporter permease subunit [Alphaproteobacteria bacterium]|nr:lipoprotein-releasing ABC transporter permease subunit [Alphaproteobacteria bacterium]MBN9569272.1 lipoprotein-releasing ABC transporter permease subunit [Alphaproteobacteria bacterium]MBN9570546.1 lipoprotein-releasing ABC transporter permease subunit [Alphaproteobacteria bacterium]OJU56540.1 MAG: multidrug ABC transporter substrate-binding protein [Alphaproteobacteria bacterium 62-8]
MANGTRAFAPFEWMIALRYLRARRKEGFVSVISVISLIGIALGVATLIIVMSVMNGFRHELLSRILGLNGHVVVQSLSGPLTDYEGLAAKLRSVSGVTRATPVVDGQVMASANGINSGALVRGITRDDLRQFTTVSTKLSPGALARFQGGDSVIVGYRLAQKLGLLPGMNITLIAPEGNVTPFGTTPRVKTYSIAGTFNIGMSEYDATFIFMPLEEAQLYFNMNGSVSDLEVMVTNPDNLGTVIPGISRTVGPHMRIVTWQDMNSSLFGALQVERNVMFLILTLIILVAALNIVSGLVMLVKDKGGDIAILRTMGAARGAVMRVFFIAGASIGVLGTITGLIIGVVFCSYIEEIRQFLSSLTGTTLFNPEIYFLSKMPAEMDMGEVIAVVAMALSLSFLATLYPSWRAARLDPVEALRYE